MLPPLLILASYLLGSIPFGYLIVRGRGGGDVRESGSGGTGATNVTRRAGKWAGVMTLALDGLKGAAAVMLARWLTAQDFGVNAWVSACAVAVIVGHCFPVWLKFRGGKGVAPGLGVFLALSPLVVPFAVVTFLFIVWRTRYVSLGSITSAVLVPLLLLLLGPRAAGADGRVAERVVAAAIGAALIVFMHRANIGRLLQRTESKLKL